MITTQPFKHDSDPSPYFEWLAHVPARLRARLKWSKSYLTKVPDARGILLLWAGKDDPTSLDSAIHVEDPSNMSWFVKS